MKMPVPALPRRTAASSFSALPKTSAPRSPGVLCFLTALAGVLFSALTPAAAQGPGALEELNSNVAGEYVRSVVTQPDGKIIIGGKFLTVQGVSRNNIARLNTDGTLDTTFDVATNDAVYTIVVQPDGKILVGGHFTGVKPTGTASVFPRSNLARLNADGTLDTAFNPNANETVSSMALHTDGRIVIGGYFTTLKPPGEAAPIPFKYLARLSPDGIPEPEFSYYPTDFIYCVAAQDDGKVLIGGRFVNSDRQYIARINTDLTLDDTFIPAVNGVVNCIAIQGDGRIVLGGAFTLALPGPVGNPVTRNRILRLNSAGTLDPSFNPNCNGSVECIAIQTDRRILLGGAFTTLQPGANPVSRVGLARINADGSVDTSFNPRADDDVTAITVQQDGKILVGGYFTKFIAANRKYFARLYNSPPTQTLTSVSSTQLLWQRSGALHEVEQVQFDMSTDAGDNWTPLGPGERIPSTTDWRLVTAEPMPAGFRARARARTGSGGHGSGMHEFISEIGPSPLQAWNIQWFSNPDGTGDAAPDADPNGNNIPNLLEYALGGDPAGQTIGTGILPSVTTDTATGSIKLSLTRYPAHSDLTLTIQAADDLAGPWEDAAQSTAGNPFQLLVPEYAIEEIPADPATTVAVTCTDKPAPGAVRRYMRLKVTGPQPADPP